MFLWFVTYILIPVYTIFFVQDSNWFTTNFSVIGSSLEKQEEFVLWGLVVGIYFYWHLRKIIREMTPAPRGMWLIPLSFTLLTFAITTPYLPKQFPLKAFLHVIFAFTAAVCLILCIFLVLWKLTQNDPQQYRPYLWNLYGIITISALLLILAGIVSSALEIFYTISTTILVRRMYISTKSEHSR